MRLNKNISWQGKYEKLVSGGLSDGVFPYKCVKDVLDFNQSLSYSVIFIDHLDPDFFIFFSSIKCIVTRKGSSLSHLSILAREYQISVIKVDFPVEIPLSGNINIDKENNILCLC